MTENVTSSEAHHWLRHVDDTPIGWNRELRRAAATILNLYDEVARALSPDRLIEVNVTLPHPVTVDGARLRDALHLDGTQAIEAMERLSKVAEEEFGEE